MVSDWEVGLLERTRDAPHVAANSIVVAPNKRKDAGERPDRFFDGPTTRFCKPSRIQTIQLVGASDYVMRLEAFRHGLEPAFGDDVVCVAERDRIARGCVHACVGRKRLVRNVSGESVPNPW